MSTAISRRRLASVVVDRLASQPRAKVMSELAAYLVEEGLARELDLVVSDIEQEYAERGHVVANITSARALDDTSRSELTQFIEQAEGATSVELREDVDSELIGGVIIQTPGKYLDGSIKHQLNQLNQMKSA